MRHAHQTSRDGFSLIEVLIAVVVLAFGLLGLAAVFPAVVKQQTTAKDSVQGVSVLRSAEAWILGNVKLNEHQTISNPGPNPASPPPSDRVNRLDLPQNRLGWEMLVADTNWHSDLGGDVIEANWPPVTVRADVYASGGASVIYESLTGKLAIGRPMLASGVTTQGIVIPLASRLFPSPYSDPNARPEYVWDFVARRVDTSLPHTFTGTPTQDRNKYEDDTVELVIFVRRIDPGIRVNPTGNYPRAYALADALLGVAGGNPTSVAISERADGTPTQDGARGNGSAYSAPKRLAVSFPDTLGRLDSISLALVANEPQTAILVQAEQVGQALVDSLGIVHRVREVQAKNPQNPGDNAWVTRLIVEPPFDTRIKEWARVGGTSQPQVIFTTQIPAAVGVLRIDPRKGGRL